MLPGQLREGARLDVLVGDDRPLVGRHLQQPPPVPRHVLSFNPHELHPRGLVLDKWRVVTSRHYGHLAADGFTACRLEDGGILSVPMHNVRHQLIQDLDTVLRTSPEEELARLGPAHLPVGAGNADAVPFRDSDPSRVILRLDARVGETQHAPLVHPNAIVVGPRSCDRPNNSNCHAFQSQGISHGNGRRTSSYDCCIIHFVRSCCLKLNSCSLVRVLFVSLAL
mmetsp:Transcript_18223/g.59876  ORF Transcript_18223/g.59876 Transcript_18223/m.59876 type:complete len:224 (-) Transcript_18223:477-1148(-)